MAADPVTRPAGPGGGLDGRVALVTGASSGIGRAITHALAGAGARVLAVGRDAARLEETAATARAGSDVVPVACDLTGDDAIRALVDRVAAGGGALHVLVLAAAIIEFGRVEDAAVGELDAMLATNLRAPYLLTQAMLPPLHRGRGHVVFVNSSAGVRATPGVAAYGATKHALRGLADALRDEVNASGIRVTSVYPGRTRTPLGAAVFRWEGQDEPLDLLEPDDVAAMVLALVSLPPTAEVTDLHIRPAVPPHLRRARPAGPAEG